MVAKNRFSCPTSEFLKMVAVHIIAKIHRPGSHAYKSLAYRAGSEQKL